MLYISPLQDKLDLAPLSSDAEEFAHMPKAECKNCKTIMPLQLLALHVTQCRVLECSSDTDLECVSEDQPEVLCSYYKMGIVSICDYFICIAQFIQTCSSMCFNSLRKTHVCKGLNAVLFCCEFPLSLFVIR